MALTNLTMADLADISPYEGENVDTTWTDTEREEVGLQAEAFVCCLVRYDAVTNWATIGAIEKKLMTEYVARSIAVSGIAFNMAGFTSRIEAENMLNINIWRLRTIEKLLVDQKTLTFIKAGTV